MQGRYALEFSEGDRLPPLAPGLKPQQIATIEADPVLEGFILFTTTEGRRWSFPLRERVAFPRRDTYGTPKTWTGPTPPRLGDMCVGDTYASLTITGMSVVVGLLWSVDCWDSELRCHVNYHIHREEQFTLPRPVSRSNRYIPPRDGFVHVFGPYEHNLTGHRFLFAAHLWGRGRWPINIPQLADHLDAVLSSDVPAGERLHITRPPTRWNEFTYRGDLAEQVADLASEFVYDPCRHPKHAEDLWPGDGVA